MKIYGSCVDDVDSVKHDQVIIALAGTNLSGGADSGGFLFSFVPSSEGKINSRADGRIDFFCVVR